MVALTTTIISLIVDLKAINAKLVTVIYHYTWLQAELTTVRAGGGTGAGEGDQRRNVKVTYTHYCWTHSQKASYASSKCTHRGEGYCVDQTHTNRKGGRAIKWTRPRSWLETLEFDKIGNNVNFSNSCSSSNAIADSSCTKNYICITASFIQKLNVQMNSKWNNRTGQYFK